jgi:hypothetical protein
VRSNECKLPHGLSPKLSAGHGTHGSSKRKNFDWIMKNALES